ncbi:MAG: PKD domain-containing protein [Chloroflexota bacterium]
MVSFALLAFWVNESGVKATKQIGGITPVSISSFSNIQKSSDDNIASRSATANTPLAITLELTHTFPVFAGFPVTFTITAGETGTSKLPVPFILTFGDSESDRVSGEITQTKTTFTHTYQMAGTYPASAVSVSGSGFITTSQQVRVRPPNRIYTPMLANNYKPKPDLLTCSINVKPENPDANDIIDVSVVISTTKAFTESLWTELYINPPGPVELNMPWGTNCDEPCRGIAWAVDGAAMVPNTPYTLISIPATKELLANSIGYSTTHTNWPMILPEGVYQFKALVDSVNLDTDYGAVLEHNEGNNVCEWAISVSPVTQAHTQPATYSRFSPPERP